MIQKWYHVTTSARAVDVLVETYGRNRRSVQGAGLLQKSFAAATDREAITLYFTGETVATVADIPA